jgi:N-terminal domain of toast_rack, DUF2154
MHARGLNEIGLPATLLGMILYCGCGQSKVGDLKMESRSVDLGGAESVRVELRIGVGELRVSGGAKKLLEADFLYNVSQWKPVVKYDVNGGQGVLSIVQPSFGSNGMGNTRNEWNLSLSDAVPMDLKIECGVGKSNFELGGLMLTGLDVQSGVGEATLDLIGDWKRDLHASVKGGIGQLTLRLPDKIGVHVQAEKAIGSIHATGLRKEDNAYVNDAFGKSKVTLHLHIQTGIGEIRLESGG